MINIKSLLVGPEILVIDAIKTLEANEIKILLVVDTDQHLLGTITDGDIRRGLLKGIALQDSVSKIMHQNPTFALQSEPKRKKIQLMKDKVISHLPILDENRVVITLMTDKEMNEYSYQDIDVVLMVGGLGTRLGELTTEVPKPMLKVNGKPILEIIINNFKTFGFNKFHFAVNYKSQVIEDYFGDGSHHDIKVNYLREKERMGTAGALTLLPKNIKNPILVMNGDVLTKVNFAHLFETHCKQKSVATMCVRQYDFQVPFGVVKTDQEKIVEIQEKPKHSFFVNTGIYCLSAEALAHIPENSFYDMTTLFNKLIKEQQQNVNVFPIHEYWLDVGRPDDFDQAQFDYKKEF